MGAPSELFLRILYRSPLGSVYLPAIGEGPRSVSSLTVWGHPQVSFFAYYMGSPSGQFVRLLYGGPLRTVSSLTMSVPPDQFLRILYGGPPQMSFFCLLYGPAHPLRSVSLLTIWGPPHVSFLLTM